MLRTKLMKYILIIILAFSIIPLNDVYAISKLTPFNDVPAGHMHEKAIKWAYDNKIIIGDNSKFGPEDNLTEAQFVIMLCRYGNIPVDETFDGSHYSDKYYKALEYKNLQFDGYSDSKAKDMFIMRGKIAQIITQVYGLDYNLIGSVGFMYINNLSAGTSTVKRTFDTYGVDLNLTRSAAVAFLQRMSQVSSVVEVLTDNIIPVSPRQIIGLKIVTEYVSDKNDIINTVKYNDSYLLSCFDESDRHEVYEINSSGVVNQILSINLDFHSNYIHNQIMYGYYDRSLGLFNLETKEIIRIPDSWDSSPEGFYKSKPYVVYSNPINGKIQGEICIYDYQKQVVVKKIAGSYPSISLLDDTLYFVRNKSGHDGEGESTILSYDIDADLIEERKTIKITKNAYASVWNIIPISADKYIYSFHYSNEKSWLSRYYSNVDTYSNIPSEFTYSPPLIDQSDICLASDGTFFCYTEDKYEDVNRLILNIDNSIKSISYNDARWTQINKNGIYFIGDYLVVYYLDFKTMRLNRVAQVNGSHIVIKRQ